MSLSLRPPRPAEEDIDEDDSSRDSGRRRGGPRRKSGTGTSAGKRRKMDVAADIRSLAYEQDKLMR